MEFYQTAYRYLKRCQVRISKSHFKRSIKGHPEYPALISLAETLEEFGIEYEANISEKKLFQYLSYPAFVNITNRGVSEFTIVNSSKDFQRNNSELLNQWNGVSIIIPRGQKIKDLDHNEVYAFESLRNIFKYLIVIIFFFFLFVHQLFSFSREILYTQLSSIIGLFFSVLIVRRQLGESISFVERLCDSHSSSNCDTVLNSTKAKINKYLGWGDVGIIYFLTILFFTISASYIFSNSAIISFLSIPFLIGLGVSIASLIVQKYILKAWCRLCLIIVGVLLFQGAAVLLLFQNLNVFPVSLSITLFYFGSVFLVMIFYLYYKLTLKFTNSLEVSDIKNHRFKRHPSIITAFLTNTKKVDYTIWSDDIIIGDSTAKNDILFICNPFCGPCGKAHEQIGNILFSRGIYDTRLIIRFVTFSSIPDYEGNIAIGYILNALDKVQSEHDKHCIFKDWFTDRSIESFSSIYPSVVLYDEIRDYLMRCEYWSTSNGIQYTPAIFLNGKEITDPYTVFDIRYLLNSQYEDIIISEAQANAY